MADALRSGARETELVKVKVDAVKAEHASNLRELVRRNEDLAAVGEALEREREARARCEERLRKAQRSSATRWKG